MNNNNKKQTKNKKQSPFPNDPSTPPWSDSGLCKSKLNTLSCYVITQHCLADPCSLNFLKSGEIKANACLSSPRSVIVVAFFGEACCWMKIHSAVPVGSLLTNGKRDSCSLLKPFFFFLNWCFLSSLEALSISKRCFKNHFENRKSKPKHILMYPEWGWLLQLINRLKHYEHKSPLQWSPQLSLPWKPHTSVC